MNESYSRSWLTAAVIVLTIASSGCPNSNGPSCPEECPRGFRCDEASGTCVPDSLARYERELPGRAVRAAASAARVWTASLDPADDNLVVTEFAAGTDPDARILTTLDPSNDRRLAIDASGRLLAVAWLGGQNHYEIALRDIPGSHAEWRFLTVDDPPQDSYTGTHDFDLEVVGDKGLALAFRDRTGTLRFLSTDGEASPWSIEPVDEGGATDDGVTCPEELRGSSSAAGVGRDPDLAFFESNAVIAYQDADCGDLRLARRGDQRWAVSAVDTGDPSADASATRGFVGRWPSIAFGPGGIVALAYHDVSGGRLMYAVEDSGRFDVQTVDAGIELDEFSRDAKRVVGAWATLSFDSSSTPTITYFDGTTANLKVARRPSSDWTLRVLEADGAVGFFADHVVDPGRGRVVVAERVRPGGDGLTSELVILEEEQ
jgi:hypothetical protein